MKSKCWFIWWVRVIWEKLSGRSYVCLATIAEFCVLMCSVRKMPPLPVWPDPSVRLCPELQTREHADSNGPVQFCWSSLLGGVLPPWSSWKTSRRRRCDLLLPEHLPGYAAGKCLQVRITCPWLTRVWVETELLNFLLFEITELKSILS